MVGFLCTMPNWMPHWPDFVFFFETLYFGWLIKLGWVEISQCTGEIAGYI